MTQISVPVRWIPDYLHRARSDSLVRNSLYLMASTVVTAGLGYIFWVLAAHKFTSQEVGISSAVISLCSTVALLTYLGSSALLIERLPAIEHSSEWTTVLIRVCVITAGVTAVATAVVVPLLLSSQDYHLFFNSALPVLLAVVGAAAWTLVNLFGAAFIAARRAGRLLTIQTLISTAKILFVLPLAVAGAGASGLVQAWVASALLGVGVGAAWLLPRMGLGRRPGLQRRRAAIAPGTRPRQYRHPRHRRDLAPPSADSVRHWLGQHLTSAGGSLIPLALPVLVVLRLGVTQNAYFYVTEMIGAAFFMVSPAVAQAVFAEGVRTHSDLRSLVAKALRVIAVLLAPPVVIVIVGGKFILGLFGPSYAAAGYELLVLLAISAVPDAVSNVAVVVCRVTGRLAYSTALNIGIMVMTLGGAWVLMPSLGINGVGVAWLGAQTIGAIASLPAYARLREPLPAGLSAHARGEEPAAGAKPDAGIAQLIDLAKQQSLVRLSARPP
jgi:O-antigen/teichoic acid export membrane protein